MVSIIRDRVRDLMDAGMTLDQIKAASPARGYTRRYGSDSGALDDEPVHRGDLQEPPAGEVDECASVAGRGCALRRGCRFSRPGPGDPRTPRAAAGGAAADRRGASAPIDLTGYWVAVVNEDWRYRMVTPPKGDYRGVPITKEALQIVNAWDPAADEAAGEQCKSYGAGAQSCVCPARLHVTWQDDNTLRVDVDAGTQTRLFRFHARATRLRTRQADMAG